MAQADRLGLESPEFLAWRDQAQDWATRLRDRYDRARLNPFRAALQVSVPEVLPTISKKLLPEFRWIDAPEQQKAVLESDREVRDLAKRFVRRGKIHYSQWLQLVSRWMGLTGNEDFRPKVPEQEDFFSLEYVHPAFPGYFLMPITTQLSLPELNHLMSTGARPLGILKKHEEFRFDGNPNLRGRREYFEHDLDHFTLEIQNLEHWIMEQTRSKDVAPELLTAAARYFQSIDQQVMEQLETFSSSGSLISRSLLHAIWSLWRHELYGVPTRGSYASIRYSSIPEFRITEVLRSRLKRRHDLELGLPEGVALSATEQDILDAIADFDRLVTQLIPRDADALAVIQSKTPELRWGGRVRLR